MRKSRNFLTTTENKTNLLFLNQETKVRSSESESEEEEEEEEEEDRECPQAHMCI